MPFVNYGGIVAADAEAEAALLAAARDAAAESRSDYLELRSPRLQAPESGTTRAASERSESGERSEGFRHAEPGGPCGRPAAAGG
jgi:hypothetical protein